MIGRTGDLWNNGIERGPQVVEHLRAADPLTRPRRGGAAVKATRTCSVPDCDRKHRGRGYCSMHHERWSKHGDPHIVAVGHRWSKLDPAVRLRERSEWRGNCLIYTWGAEAPSGHVTMDFEGRSIGVHRGAWILVHGPVPKGLVIRHECDTPRCINIDHLLSGTRADNNADRDRRGRQVVLKGERNGSAKLTLDSVRVIRARLAAGESTRSVAADYGVSQFATWSIKAGRTWKDQA